LMVFEHVFKGVLDSAPLFAWVPGRAVFPTFVLAFACAAAGLTLDRLPAIARRMLKWGAITLLPLVLMERAAPLNILFTFALGVGVYYWWWRADMSRWRVALVVVLLVLGFVVEYGPLGVLGVAFGMHGARVGVLWKRYVYLGGSVALLCWQQGTFIPAAACGTLLVFWSLFEVRVPRLRGVFYRLYALHWCVIGAVRALV